MDILVFLLGLAAIYVFLRIWLQNLAETDSGVTTVKNGRAKGVIPAKDGAVKYWLTETAGYGYHFDKDTGLRMKGERPDDHYDFFTRLFFLLFGVYPIILNSVLKFDIKLIDEKKNERTEKAHSIILKGIYNVLAKEVEAKEGANPQDILIQANTEFYDLRKAIGNNWYNQLQDSLLAGIKIDANEHTMEEMLGVQKDAIYHPIDYGYDPIDGDTPEKIKEATKATSKKINDALEISKGISKEIKRLKKLILSADTAEKEKKLYEVDLAKIEDKEITGLEKLLLTANAYLIEHVGIAITKLSVLGVDISNPKTKEAMELKKIAEEEGDAKIVTARKEGEASIITAEKKGEALKMSATKLGEASIITATKQIEVKKLEVLQMEQEGKAEAVKLEKILNAKASGYKKMYNNFDKKSDAFAASRTADGMGEFSKNGGNTLVVPTFGTPPAATISVPAEK